VQPRADVLGEEHVAGDDRLLGDRGPPGEADLGRDDALVHLGPLGEPRLLGVLGDDTVERLDVLQGAAHEDRVGDALPVVREDAHLGGGVGHGAELGEMCALEADAHGTDRVDVGPPGVGTQAPDLLDDAGGVLHRGGVRHRVDGGEAADRGGAGAGADGLRVLAPGLAQVRVQVDEAREGDEVPSLDDDRAVAGDRRPGGDDLGDDPVREEDVDALPAEGGDVAQEVGRRCVCRDRCAGVGHRSALSWELFWETSPASRR
jgi:hypothetical protein